MSTPTPVPTSLPAEVQAFISGLFATFKIDELQAIVPDLATFFSAWAKNPTVIEFQAALGELQMAVIAAQPNIAQALLAQAATAMNALAQQVLAQQSGTASAGTATAAAA